MLILPSPVGTIHINKHYLMRRLALCKVCIPSPPIIRRQHLQQLAQKLAIAKQQCATIEACA